MTALAILVVVPTTGGPLRLRALTPRPGLPAPAAFADGDYRPLPWSADYARLCAAGGPLARLTGGALPPHELRLTGSFDAGRSWEVPVCLAHGLVARGHRLAAEPAQADLILWATGAVDLDLAVLPGDYALLDKVERSRALLAEAPEAGLAVLLPEGPERERAEAAFRALGRAPHVLPAESVPAALARTLAALAGPAQAGPATAVPPRRRPRLALPAGAVAGLGLVILAALGTRHAPVAGPGEPSAPEPPPAEPAPSQDSQTRDAPTRDARKPQEPAKPSEAPPAAEAAPSAAPPAIRVEELRAPAGSSCRRVAFGAEPPERRPVPAEAADRLAPTRLAPDLCGIAVRAGAPGLRVEVGPELRAAALPPVRLADGAQGYFLREGVLRASAPQNLVYAVQALPEAGTGAGAGSGPPGPRLVHALVHPPTR